MNVVPLQRFRPSTAHTMSADSRSESDARIALLESRIAALEARLTTASVRRRARSRAGSTAELERRASRWSYQSEQWLGRVGLGLLFLGLIYLFQYSIEQGWITPVVRVAFGIALGTAMLTLGLRLGEQRRSFGQLLLAGSVAIYYATGWAAFQLYELIGHAVGFGYMTAVMGLALTLSLRRSQQALASLAAAGGFLTPLLLQRGEIPVIELAVYSTLVVGWAARVYAARGWRSLLWTYAAGGIMALTLAVQHAAAGERLVVQVAVTITWILAAAYPFIRGLTSGKDTRRALWGLVSFGLQLRLLGVGASTAAVLLVGRLWAMTDLQVGLLFLALATGYAAFSWIGTRQPNVFARSAAPVAAALYATGTLLIVTSASVLVTLLALQALLFVYLGSRERFAGLEWVGHMLFALLALHLVRDALLTEWSFLDPLATAQAVQIALMFAASFYVRSVQQAWIYRVAAHLLMLGWLGKELSPISEGRAIVTVAWGVYGAALLAAALQWRARREVLTLGLQVVAFSALALAVGKLLAVDLVRVAMLWRVILFMGFGAGLLALSSMFRARQPGQ